MSLVKWGWKYSVKVAGDGVAATDRLTAVFASENASDIAY